MRTLGPAELCKRCDPASLGFTSTAELEPLDEPFGHSRAVEALEFAVSMDAPGYNLFAIGPSGLRKHDTIRRLLERKARRRSRPSDYCYVFDFQSSKEPRALELPAGRGRKLVSDVKALVDDLRSAIPAAFEGEEYAARIQALEDELKDKRSEALEALQQEANAKSITMVPLPAGFAFAPMVEGKVIGPDEYQELEEQQRDRLQAAVKELQKKLQEVLRQAPRWSKELRDRVRELNRDVTRFAVEVVIEQVVQQYEDLPAVVEYLRALENDVIESVDLFRKGDDEQNVLDELRGKQARFTRYEVNLLVDHADSRGAPVVYEDRPAVDRLLGAVEHRAEFGNLVSDFRLVRSGALHRASGGYLIVDMRGLLTQPLAWSALKRALYAREVRIEPVSRLLGVSGTASLEPEPIPIDVKVVLVGPRRVYHMLTELDPDVADLFKVVADFDEKVPRNSATEKSFARLVAAISSENHLRAFDAAAVARLVEHATRLAGDSEELSTNRRALTDAIREADQEASQQGHDLVTAADVTRAIDATHRRQRRMADRLQEVTLQGTIMVDTSGEKVGQVNGLAVLRFGHYAFGRPSRITATARVGNGGVVDVEREVELGGTLHSKGVLILSNYFASRYSRDFPLSLAGSLVFEQSYAGVEGDSASLAELCALLSTLADLPVRQSVAVTGSVSQHGAVQAIGGVNEKIEGFFDLCRERGLTGDQGCVIPASNVRHLMLRQDVVRACAEGKFHVYPVETVDEAIETLTGVEAGAADEDGTFPESSVNARVLQQLLDFAIVAVGFAKLVSPGSKEDTPSKSDGGNSKPKEASP